MEPFVKKQFKACAEQLEKLNQSQIVELPVVLIEAFDQTKSFVENFQKIDNLKSYEFKLEQIFLKWDEAIISLEIINPLISDIIKDIRKYFLNPSEFLIEIQNTDDKMNLFLLLDKSIHSMRKPRKI